jgi:hypothetical protein
MMNSLALCCALATLGVDTGWEPAEGGGLVYIIQLEPTLLDVLREGEQITSEVPPELESVRRYRIVVGDAELPRLGAPTRQPSERPGTGQAESALPPPPDGLGLSSPAPIAPDPTSTDLAGSADSGSGPPVTSAPSLSGKPGSAGQPSPSTQAQPNAGDGRKESPRPTAAPAKKTWLPLVWALTGLFVSMGANIYLGWIAWDSRRHYHNLLRESGHGDWDEGQGEQDEGMEEEEP